jgi:tungstate transport system substrate-binding protein
MRKRMVWWLALFLATALLDRPVSGEERFITGASTTSTEQSGLFDHLLPIFTAKTGIDVRVIAQGTGQALQTGARGDADVVLVHDPESEKRFVAEGHGVRRHPVMYNDFVLVGPIADPAGVKGSADAVEALRRIAASGAPFASRGDDSGTHQAELRLWTQAGVEPKGRSWYRETGSGMGPTLNTAAGLGAYALTDRATWLAFANKQDLAILAQGDKRLFNQYAAILVNPERHPHVKAEWAQAFIDWLISPDGQRAIADYRIGGQQLFFPNADDPSA